MKKIILCLCCLLPSVLLAESAASLHAAVKALKLSPQSSSESNGDEIYFNVSVYLPDGEMLTQRIPEYPLHWTAASMEEISNLLLWDNPIKPDESFSIVLSVAEQDIPPWNADDLIGAVHIKLKNEQGKLLAVMGLANDPQAQAVTVGDRGYTKQFVLMGGGVHYDLTLMVFQE